MTMPLFRPQATYPPMLIHDAMPPLSERENIGLKLRAARKRAGLTTAQAAEVGGISVTQLGAIERGNHSLTSMSAGNLSRLPAAFGLTWERFVEIVAPVYGPYIAFIPSPALPADEIRPVPDLHRVPVRGMAAAGAAFYSEDNILDYEYVAADEYRPGMLAVQIDGDSMEPTVPNGSRVYVDTSLTNPQDGKMFLIHVRDNGFIVKRAKAVGASWLLLSDNPKHPALTPDEAAVIGQVYFIQPRGWRA